MKVFSRTTYKVTSFVLIIAAFLYGVSGSLETLGYHSKLTQKGFDVAAKSLAALSLAVMMVYTANHSN